MTPTTTLPFQPKVLVVDDEKRIRDGCRLMLSQEGFNVALAANGQEGLDAIESEHFDIILLDLMMPGISGLDVLEKLKTVHPDTAVIVITGYSTLEHSIEAMKRGAFDFIPKPFSPQDLRDVISKALSHIAGLHDITQEKSRTRVLINYLADGVMAADKEERVALANPAFLKLIKKTGENIIGRPASDLVGNPDLVEMIKEALRREGEDHVELTEELEFEDDKVIQARCVPFRDRAKRTLGVITVLHDITAQKKMDQLKSDFVSMVAHEIRSPMNSVLMQLKVVLDGLAGEVTPKQSEILNRSTERIKSLVALSSELLDLARIESGLLTQEMEPVDITEIIQEQIQLHLPTAQAAGQSLSFDSPPGLPRLPANRQNMEEVFSNLITNAIKYSPEGGEIKVKVLFEDDCFKCSVADNGYGIPPEDQARVFDRFFRVKNENTRYITGTGLGLPIVKSIVEAHNGRIDLESEPGRGTVFTVFLPLAGFND